MPSTSPLHPESAASLNPATYEDTIQPEGCRHFDPVHGCARCVGLTGKDMRLISDALQSASGAKIHKVHTLIGVYEGGHFLRQRGKLTQKSCQAMLKSECELRKIIAAARLGTARLAR